MGSRISFILSVLTRYLPKTVVRKEKNLLGGKDEATIEEEEEVRGQLTVWLRCFVNIPLQVVPDVIVSHWHKVSLPTYCVWSVAESGPYDQNLTLALVSDNTVIPYNQIPPVVHERQSYLNLTCALSDENLSIDVRLVQGQRDSTGTAGYYLPIIFPNEFWNLRSQYIEINSTTPILPLQIVFQPMSYFKFQIFASMTHGFNEAAKQQGGVGNAETDEIKRMLVETNPYFLALTALVSMLHVLSVICLVYGRSD